MNRIVCGDALVELQKMPVESVDCIITSPPYWGLRDYGIEGQIGLEDSPEKFIEKMVAVFREAKRVLAEHGTLWLNIGDSYANNPGNGRGGEATIGNQSMTGAAPHRSGRNKVVGNLKPKDLVGIPWMLAFALRADGWYLRSDIIWAKPNPMPESVTDRPTKAHEYVFLLSKSPKYYYDAAAIKTQSLESSRARLSQDIESQAGSLRVPGKTNGPMKAVGGGWAGGVPPLKDLPGSGNKLGAFRDKQRGHGRRHAGFNDRWDAMPKEEQQMLANKRTVWTVATMPFKEAHFATFPEKLIEPMILAGTLPGGVVLDPFMGAGTTALVAKKLGRQYLGIELNPEYIAMAEKRLNRIPSPLF